MRAIVSVIIPTHNPHADRLARTLDGLRKQTLPTGQWECLLVDNASSPALDRAELDSHAPGNLRLLRESSLGLTAARRHGLRAAAGAYCVLVDDDNILAPTYLADVARIFADDSELGAAGGPSRPEFEIEPPAWTREFFPLLALRDLGPTEMQAQLSRSPNGAHHEYPACAPIGAGMTLRRSAISSWLEGTAPGTPSDRRGSELTSGGDNDIVLHVLHGGWHVGYFPELALTHLIPANRLEPRYLARLNRGIQKSWVEVLAQHGANPWAPVPRWTVPLRQAKAWFATRAWSNSSAHVRWQGLCGRLEGLGEITAATP